MHVDGRLSLEENMNDIMSTIHLIVPIENKNQKMPTRDINKFDNYEKAQLLQDLRKVREKRRDNVSTARNNFSLQQLNNKNFEKWKNNKRRYDINGIDNYKPAY